MSISRLNTIAEQRDTGTPRRPKRKAKTAEEAKETETQGYLDLLVSAIPTEPLALYTFLVGGIVATLDADGDQRLTMRWIIYAAAIAFIAIWLGLAYRRRPKSERKRAFPLAEIVSASVAFAAWGLVMPESPLGAELSGNDRIVWTLIITAGGTALLGLLTGSLKKPAKT